MKLHADLSLRAAVRTESLQWIAAPAAGVERKLIERDGKEVARATSLVRYAPASRFPSHEHGGGEEFFVLDGTFSDEHGDYPAGTYVRNPIGTAHSPHTDPGCLLLVKLRHMTDPHEPRVVKDTLSGRFTPAERAGVGVQPLFANPRTGEWVSLERWQPSTGRVAQSYPGGVEFFVLEGELQDDDGTYVRGDWLRLPPGSRHRPQSDGGCLLYVHRGHLKLPASDGPAATHH